MGEWFPNLDRFAKEKDNIKPCPLCGATAMYGNWGGGGGVWCPDCGLHLWRDHEWSADKKCLHMGGDIAVEVWNRRV